MYLLETILVVGLLLLLITQNLRTIHRRVSLVLFAVALISFLASLMLGQLRWQMLPAYWLFLVLTALLFGRSFSHVALRWAGVLLGLLLLGSGAALPLALPIIALPSPEGPYAVGTRHVWLIDESRSESYFGLPDEPRELFLRIWYPGAMPESQRPPRTRTLWQDLYQGPMDLISFLAGYMRGMETHTYPDIPLAGAGSPHPVLVFSHGYGLFAGQNTLLMEHLASHGYVVVDVNHTRMSIRAVSSRGEVIAVDPRRQQEANAEVNTLNEETLTRVFGSAGSPEELSANLAALAPTLTRQLAIRVADLRFVIDSIVMRPSADPALTGLLSQLDADRIGLIGMSFGGATVMQTCKLDMRCRAVLNLDGPLLGDQQWQTLRVPFLSMLSAWTHPFYESVLLNSGGPYYEVLVEGAEHVDFSDKTLLLPRWLRTSEIAPRRAIEVVDAASLRFFDAYLRNRPRPRFDVEEFPELRVTLNAQAEQQIGP